MLRKALYFSMLIMLLLSSCGPVDRGLLMWSHDEDNLPSGSIVDIFGESQLRSSYEIRYRDANKKVQRVELEAWRVQRAPSGTRLDTLQEEYMPYAPYFGVAEIQALPVRDAMATDASTSIIYRLTKGEQVKILSQSENEVEIGGLKDYWFEVLTGDGTRGFVYGYRLDKVDASGVSTETEEREVDEALALIIDNVWYPEYFQWMIDADVYDLGRFRSDYRFYHDSAAARFVLRTAEHELAFEYTELFQARYREYLAIGSGLHIIVYADNRISIQYDVDGRAASESLVRFGPDVDIEQTIGTEWERRQGILENFLARANRLVSSRHGVISLREDGSGQWQSYQSFGLDIFPEWFRGSFTLAFPLYLASSLQGQYDGALSFTQAGRSINSSMNFFYTYINGGLQLEYIPERNIDGNVVERQARSPVTFFFTLFIQ